jgi:hypothetical protein
MTRLLEEAFRLARQLPDDEQDELASRIIAELSGDDAFDRKIAATVNQLDWLFEEARADFRAGRTEEIDPERL